MAISSEEFRNVLRHFPAGVTIVAVRAGEETHGLTVSAFASIAPEPPLVMVIIDHKHRAYPLLERAGAVFSVNILRQDQVEMSNRFAWVKDEDRFEVGDWTTAKTGAPVLADCLAWMDCTIHGRYATATNTIYVGEIQACGVPHPDEPPLLYWNRGYRHLDLLDPDKTKKKR
ncbi:MAG TPA: flavin reductase family protein [Thermoanaerobaculia bacterium]|jgi:flavin reductase (DIM6/NTAB) family NADH-FMN oxidoreductase RutF|nr:flavin reductase family protein [Thermoanaerobaculia bacterium]